MVAILFIGTSMAGRYHERHRERGILGLGLDLLGVRPAYGYGNGYGAGYGGHRPVVATTSYYGYPAYGGHGYNNVGYGQGGYGHGGYGNGGYGNGGYGNGGYGNGGYGYLDRPGYGSSYGYDGYGRSPIRVKTVIKSKHDY